MGAENAIPLLASFALWRGRASDSTSKVLQPLAKRNPMITGLKLNSGIFSYTGHVDESAGIASQLGR